MSQAASRPRRMNVEEFLAWAPFQDERMSYELVDGEVIAMAPEKLVHAESKLAACLALRQAAAAAGLRCQSIIDGPGIKVDDTHCYQPDAMLRCGPPLPPDTILIPDPVVVVEVVSPRSHRPEKLAGYFSLPSLRHFLIVLLGERRVVHHARPGPDGPIETRVLTGGDIRLDPPGLVLPFDALFAADQPPG